MYMVSDRYHIPENNYNITYQTDSLKALEKLAINYKQGH